MQKITDDVFRKEADMLLKSMKVSKKERNDKICAWLNDGFLDRNNILDKLVADKAEHDKEKVIPSEAEEQINFVAWFKSKFPDEKIIMIRNDGTRTSVEKINQLQLGLCKGVTDLYIPSSHTWIEFKRKKGGVLSDAQKEFRNFVWKHCEGDKWILARGFEDGKKQYLEHIYVPQHEMECYIGELKTIVYFDYEVNDMDVIEITKARIYLNDKDKYGIDALNSEFIDKVAPDLVDEIEEEAQKIISSTHEF